MIQPDQSIETSQRQAGEPADPGSETIMKSMSEDCQSVTERRREHLDDHVSIDARHRQADACECREEGMLPCHDHVPDNDHAPQAVPAVLQVTIEINIEHVFCRGKTQRNNSRVDNSVQDRN